MRRTWTIVGVVDVPGRADGLLRFFRVDDFEGTLRRARTLGARFLSFLACAMLLGFAPANAQKPSGSPATKGMSVDFQGTRYVHRWSRDGQNEFTPDGDVDLTRWRDMVTVNVHDNVANGEQLAELANRVLTSYKANGKILRTDSKPRTPQRPAEHIIVAVLGRPAFLEATFARFLLADGKGIVVVYSHRIYSENAGPAMSEWLQANGPPTENALMSWSGVPAVAALKALPQSK